MAISKTEALRKRITRGSILYTLYRSPSLMMVSTLELSMIPEDPQIGSEIVPQLNYLSDRGYVKVIEPDSPSMNPMRGALVRITDKGQDVVEGTIPDDGIILPNER